MIHNGKKAPLCAQSVWVVGSMQRGAIDPPERLQAWDEDAVIKLWYEQDVAAMEPPPRPFQDWGLGSNQGKDY